MPLEAPTPPLSAPSAVLADEVYSILLAAILDERLAPGERLRDVDLAAQLGVSRTPVREAMQRLERQGLIEVSANRYTRVSARDAARRDEAAETAVALGGLALGLGTPRLTEQDRARAAAALDTIREGWLGADKQTLRRGGEEFLRILTAAMDNRILRAIFVEAHAPLQHFIGNDDAVHDISFAADGLYEPLRAAVLAGDGATAERLYRERSGLA